MTRQDDVVPPEARALEEFVRAVPELEEEWAEHLSFHGELLPYVFMIDALQYAIDHVRHADAERRRRFAMALNRLSDNDDDETVNIVAVAFFEHLVRGGPPEAATLEALRPWLSRGSLALVRAFET